MQKYLKKIKENNDQIDSELLRDIIADHKEERDRMIKLYERYKASQKGVPILRRNLIDYEDFKSDRMKRIDNKVNNMLNNAFDADIVDTKVGYMFGHPITYEFDDKREPGTSSPTKDLIDEFNIRNHVEDEDSELGKMAAICGRAARLAYIDIEGNERVKNINPWEVIFIGDDIHEPNYSIRYYDGLDKEQHAEFYNGSDIQFFTTNEAGDYVEAEVKEHLFEFNPLYGVANNKELQGDAEKVLSLIDAYDRTLSDASNEIEQYRLAYLVIKGLTAGDGTEDEMRRGKIIELLEKDDDVSYLTKDINDALIEHHLDRLEKNILKFAKSVDFTDESFADGASGVALKQKLRSLENKCITMERKFNAMLRYQWKVIFSAWSTKSKVQKEDYLKVWHGWKRNNPIHLLEEAQATQALRGHVSERTRLAALSIVDDVDYEMKEMQEDEKIFGSLLGGSMGGSLDIDEDEEESGESDDKSKSKTCPQCGGSGKATSTRTGRPIQCNRCGGDGVIST